MVKNKILIVTPLIATVVIFGVLYGGTAYAFGYASSQLLGLLGFAVVTEIVGLIYFWLMKKKSTIKQKVGICSIFLVFYWLATNQLSLELIIVLIAYIVTRLFWEHFGVTPKFLQF